jgi:hypothetical protein
LQTDSRLIAYLVASYFSVIAISFRGYHHVLDRHAEASHIYSFRSGRYISAQQNRARAKLHSCSVTILSQTPKRCVFEHPREADFPQKFKKEDLARIVKSQVMLSKRLAIQSQPLSQNGTPRA